MECRMFAEIWLVRQSQGLGAIRPSPDKGHLCPERGGSGRFRQSGVWAPPNPQRVNVTLLHFCFRKGTSPPLGVLPSWVVG